MRPFTPSLRLLAALASVAVFAGPPAARAAEPQPPAVPFIQVVPRFELGFVDVLEHHYQSGANGTHFNFVTQGGEDTLFLFQRYSADVIFAGQHYVTLLYQPLTLSTSSVANRNNTNGDKPVVIDDASFAPGTPFNAVYGFDFWRISYLYDFMKDPATILGVGLSLQIRNAAIDFTSVNGNTRAVDQNIGPVPIIKFRAARWFNPMIGLDFEADGFYASSAFFNGSGKSFTGWIWDASLSAKTHVVPHACVFVVIRSIGGGAQGNNAYSYVSSTTSVNPYSYDNLATLSVALGAALE